MHWRSSRLHCGTCEEVEAALFPEWKRKTSTAAHAPEMASEMLVYTQVCNDCAGARRRRLSPIRTGGVRRVEWTFIRWLISVAHSLHDVRFSPSRLRGCVFGGGPVRSDTDTQVRNQSQRGAATFPHLLVVHPLSEGVTEMERDERVATLVAPPPSPATDPLATEKVDTGGVEAGAGKSGWGGVAALYACSLLLLPSPPLLLPLLDL